MSYLLAIDQGTSSTRAMLYNLKGEIVAKSQAPITQYYPQPGWVEHDPEEIWQKTLNCMRAVVLQVPAKQIVGCGITNQRETTVIWNKKNGVCLAPAIVWQDRRSAEFCKTLVVHEALIQQKTGLIPDPYFSASKLKWLLENNSEAKKLAHQGYLAFGTIDSFLLWRLTAKNAHLTDTTNASRTMLFNINNETWDLELLNHFNIPECILPEVKACDAYYGLMDKQLLGIEIPITGVVGDQQAALIGQDCFKEGMIKATFGTGAFLLFNTGETPVRSKHKLLTTVAYKIKGKTIYGLEGSIYHAGTTIKWLRDSMKLISNAQETEILARSLTSNEGVYLISAFTGLGAPHWLVESGAAIFGLSLSSNRAHWARAALEGICYQTRDICWCMQEDSQLDLSLLRVDGGMSVNQWFLQFLADQCQLQVQKPKDIETTAKGAAMLAALGLEIFNSVDELHTTWDLEKTFTPQRSLEEVEQDYSGWDNILQKIKISNSTKILRNYPMESEKIHRVGKGTK